RTLEAIAIGVTTRQYRRALDPLPVGTRERAVAKSSVSRRFVALTTMQLASWLTRPLDDLAIRIIFIDGLHVREHVVLIALGVDVQGPQARPRAPRGHDRERDRVQSAAHRPAGARARPRPADPLRDRRRERTPQGAARDVRPHGGRRPLPGPQAAQRARAPPRGDAAARPPRTRRSPPARGRRPPPAPPPPA